MGLWHTLKNIGYGLLTTRKTGVRGRLDTDYGTQVQQAHELRMKSDKNYTRQIKRLRKMHEKGKITNQELRELERATLRSIIP